MNKEEFIKNVKELGIDLTERQLMQFDKYCKFLIEENKNTNLTAIKEEKQIYLKHFYDSLTFVKAIKLDNVENLLDIGTGAGFPGMVLKIVFPNIKITLLDSNNKKINFLKKLSEQLDINDISFFHGRAEEFIIKNRENFDIVTARAVTNLPALSELALPLTKVNGYFIAMKGSNTEEINDASFAIEVLGGKIEKTYNFELPFEKSQRNIIKILKIKETSKKYPRRYEQILKNPLKKSRK